MSVCNVSLSVSATPTVRRAVRLTGFLITGLLLAGCGNSSSSEDPTPEPSPTASQTQTEGADATQAPEKPEFVAVGKVEVGQGHVLLGDLDRATGLTALPHDEFLITQGETGQFLWLTDSGEVTEVTGPGADQLHNRVSDAVAELAAQADPVDPQDENSESPAGPDNDPNGGPDSDADPDAPESAKDLEAQVPLADAGTPDLQEAAPVPGVFGVALSPDFANDAIVYVFVSDGAASKVVALRWSQGEMTFEHDVLTDLPAGQGRNGGALGFGPDGYLYISVGDSGVPELAQEPTSNAGKILRILPDGTVPGNNPLSNSIVWSLGHRNVTGFTWTEQGVMYAVEQGQSIADELNLIIPGANYGWPLVEGAGREDTDGAGAGMSAQEALDRGFTAPALAWQWSAEHMTTADPVGIVATKEGLYIPGFNGQRLWRVGLLEHGLALTQEFYTRAFGPLGAIAQGPHNTLVFLTANTAHNPGANSAPLPVEATEEVPLSTHDRLIEFKVTY